jgi:hypothetical protein
MERWLTVVALLLAVSACDRAAPVAPLTVAPAAAEALGAAIDTTAVCRSVAAKAVPLSDYPSAPERAELKDCRSEDLYFGLGVAKDPVKARKCAIIEMEAEGEGDLGGPYGRGLLMMVYANGAGAPRDLDLALRLACVMPSTGPEREDRVRDLAAMRAGYEKAPPYDWCDAVTSSRGFALCGDRTLREQVLQRHARISALSAHWTPQQGRAFEALERSRETFIEAFAGELEPTGFSWPWVWRNEARGRIEADFMALLEDLEQGRPLGLSAEEARAAEAQRVEAYRRKALDLAEARADGARARPDALRESEAAWRAYRNAWLTFAKLRRPTMSAEAVSGRLARQRTELLDFPD